MTDAGAPVQCVDNEVTDVFRLIAYNIKIFGQVETLDKCIDHKGADCQAEKRVQSGFNVKHENPAPVITTSERSRAPPDIKAGIFLQDHGNDIRARLLDALDVKEGWQSRVPEERWQSRVPAWADP